MPTSVKIIIALVVIGGAFTAYYLTMADSSVGPDVKKPTGPALVKPVTEGHVFGGGEDAWVTQYDKNGRESYRFRAFDYVPQRDGTFLVTKPAAEFFLKGQGDARSRLRITGATGTVYVQQAAGQPQVKEGLLKKEDLSADFAQPPRKGRLQDVRIELFEGDDAAEPAISLAMNNAVFDNETFRIFTESFKDDAGKEVAAEWVPVTVSGRYEFRGYGLTIRWNDVDQRLELLKVFHGEKLVIKDTSTFAGGLPGRKKPAAAPAARAARGPEWSPLGFKPIDATPAVLENAALAAEVVRAAQAPAPAAAPPGSPYRATFTQQVVIKQGDQTLVSADEMDIDFLLAGSSSRPPKHQRTATRPEAKTAPAPAGPATAAPIAAAPAATPPTAPATTAAATQPDAQPITVYWRGPLEITPRAPVPTEQSPALRAGEVAVAFAGAPLVLTRDGGEVQCASLVYRTADGGSVLLRNSDRFPRVLVRQPLAAKPGEAPGPPAALSATAVEYSAASKLATLRGPSSARIPLPGENRKPGEQHDVLEAEWSQTARFHLLGEGGAETQIDRAEFGGDVRVRHPQLDLRAQQLQLAFAPAPAPGAVDPKAKPRSGGAGPSLKSIVAAERVQCDVIAANTQRQTVLCDRLELTTGVGPDGRVFPQTVAASGKVRATDEKQELLAEHVTLTLAPAPPKPAGPPAAGAPEAALASAEAKGAAASGLAAGGFGGGAIELRMMQARQNVLVRSADGALAAGDELSIFNAGPGGKSEVRLVGRPARVEDKDRNAITGPAIVVHPDSGRAEIAGAGTIDAVQRDEKDAKAPARSVHVAWTGGATVDGSEDLIAVAGDVVARIPDRDGTVNTAKGQRVEISLVKREAPATQPTPASPARKDGGAAANPAGAVAGRVQMDFFKDKQVGEITLLDEAVINSSQRAADGAVLREFQMQASRIGFDVVRRRVAVPVGGQMLVRDHRPSEAAKPGQPAQPGEGKGVSAFQWEKSLVYDEGQRQATMSGGVVVVHKPEGDGQLPVRLTADDVTATFLPADNAPKAQPKPAPGAAAAPADLTAALRLKALTAAGHIVITRDAAQVTADRIEYDPTGEWITASGTPRNPASFSDGTGTGATTAEVVQWNAKTWHVKFKNVTARVR